MDMLKNYFGENIPKIQPTEETKAETTSKINLKLQDIQDAHNRIKQHVVFTPIIAAKTVGKETCNVFFKCENLQYSGSFKARGASNLFECMSSSDKSKGCMISAGRNFIMAMCYYGLQHSVPINVVVPKDSPLSEKEWYKEHLAIVKVFGSDYNDANLHALTYCNEIGANYVRGTDRLDLMAGYGTLGLELLTQVDKLEAVICPIGSGSLIASLIVAVKSLKPNCLIYGVECSAAPAMTRALQEKKPVMVQPQPTVADSLSHIIASTEAYNVIRRYIDKIIIVDEVWISRAMITMLETEKIFIEGAAACPVAAILAGKVPELRGKNVACILSGGNINSSRLSSVVEHGMAAAGRLARVSMTLPDAPGALAALLARLTDAGADVKSCVTERTGMMRNVFTLSGDEAGSDLPHILTFNEIKQAAERIESGIIHTPLCEAKLSKYMDYNIYFKCENLQYSGSYVERGIRNVFLCLHEDVSTHGVIVPSTGNMALAAAYHGSLLGVPVTVVFPESTSPALAHRCSELGAEVVLCGETFEDAVTYANKVHRDTGQVLINPDDTEMMAGLGSIGMEIITQLPETDAVIVPAAEGSLLAGVLVACKKLKCSCLVYGAECSKVPKMMKALQAGRPVSVSVVPNLAEGLNASTVGINAFTTIKGRLDRMLVVEESFLARAVVSMLERERLVADGAGVCAVAAVMQGLVPELRGKRTVCIVTGGNIDCGRLSRTIQRGLGASGRLLRLAVPLSDQRAGLERLSRALADESVVLKSLVTEQMWVHSDVATTWANVVVETGNEDHAAVFKERIREIYPTARFAVDIDDKHKFSIRQNM